MFSARLVGPLRRFHGRRSRPRPAAARREPAGERPVARRLRDLADALARETLDRLAEHAAGGAAEPRALDPRGRRRRGRGAASAPAPVARLGRDRRGTARGELVEQRRRGAPASAGPRARRRRGGAGSRPPRASAPRRVDVLALFAPAGVVPDEVFRLDPGDSHRGIPASLRRPTAPRRRTARHRAARAARGAPCRAAKIAAHRGHVATRLLDVDLARRARPPRPSPRARRRPRERTGERAAHRGDRVGVAAVVHAAEHGRRTSPPVATAGSRARPAAPRSRAAGSGCARSGRLP